VKIWSQRSKLALYLRRALLAVAPRSQAISYLTRHRPLAIMASVQGKHPRDPSATKGPKKMKKRKLHPVVEGAPDDVLAWEVKSFLNSFGKEVESENEEEALPFSKFDEVEVTIKEFTSSGDSPVRVCSFVEETDWA